MRHIKDVLRLKLELKHSHQHIAASLGISKGVVAKYVKLASTAGLHWPQIQAMDETALHNSLMGGAPQRASGFVAADYAQVRQELQRKGMTLMLLWQEHSERHPDGAKTSGWPRAACARACQRAWARALPLSLRRLRLPMAAIQAQRSQPDMHAWIGDATIADAILARLMPSPGGPTPGLLESPF